MVSRNPNSQSRISLIGTKFGLTKIRSANFGVKTIGGIGDFEFVVMTNYISMTSLFAHNVAQPTKWRFLSNNLSQLVIFVIEQLGNWKFP